MRAASLAGALPPVRHILPYSRTTQSCTHQTSQLVRCLSLQHHNGIEDGRSLYAEKALHLAAAWVLQTFYRMNGMLIAKLSTL